MIYTSDKAMAVRHCLEIQQKLCRYFHRYSGVEQLLQNLSGAFGSAAVGKPFVNIQGMLSPSSRSVTPQWLWWPWRKFFVCLDGGKGFLKHKVTQHEQKTQLNPITQLLNSGNLFWDSFLPKSQSKTLHHCMFSTS